MNIKLSAIYKAFKNHARNGEFYISTKVKILNIKKLDDKFHLIHPAVTMLQVTEII
jgi:hypothetical protein